MADRPLVVVDLGRIPYGEALDLQRRLVAEKKAGAIDEDFLLLLEHPPVITLGRRADEANIVADAETLAARGIEVHQVERGGDVTYHGPGQLVGYPIVALRHLPHRRDVGRFVWTIQEAIIQSLVPYGIVAERIDRVIGVWVRGGAPRLAGVARDEGEWRRLEEVAGYADRKIAAIGARIEGWVSYHGFALNVSTDLTDFGLIVPCGLRERGVTSIAAELGRPVEMAPVRERVARELATRWGFREEWRGAESLASFRHALS